MSSPYPAPNGLADLNGSAYNVEDGVLEGAALVRTSSKDGMLGNGKNLTGELSSGEHLVTLTATVGSFGGSDGDGGGDGADFPALGSAGRMGLLSTASIMFE